MRTRNTKRRRNEIKAGPAAWTDAQAMHAADPCGFQAPSAADVAALEVGDLVKIRAEAAGERFWATITATDKRDADPFRHKFTAAVDSCLVRIVSFGRGDCIQLEGRHIYQTDTDTWAQLVLGLAVRKNED
jgi:hypothetical protein